MTEQTTTEPLRTAAEPAPWGALSIADDLCLSGLGETQFGAIVLARGIPHTAGRQFGEHGYELEPEPRIGF